MQVPPCAKIKDFESFMDDAATISLADEVDDLKSRATRLLLRMELEDAVRL